MNRWLPAVIGFGVADVWMALALLSRPDGLSWFEVRAAIVVGVVAGAITLGATVAAGAQMRWVAASILVLATLMLLLFGPSWQL